MRVIWRKRALNDLAKFHEWLSTIDGAEPDRTILRIRAAADTLERLGDIGRPGREPGTRELSLRMPPYVIVYRTEADTVDILAAYHTAQNR
jgi:plasmid stabilization system protein ParE